MAIQFSVKPKLIAPSGLSLTNPITAIAQKLPSDTDTYAVLKVYDRDNVLFCELRSSFIIDANGNHIAVFEVSEILKSIYQKQSNPSLTAPPYAQVPFLTTFMTNANYDFNHNFSKYYLEIANEKKHFFVVDAGLENYNLYFVFVPNSLANYQSDFFDYTILPDDINIPIVFAVDFDETDFDETDFN